MSGGRHTSFIDTLFTANAANDECKAGCKLAVCCCVLAAENVISIAQEAKQKNYAPVTFRTSFMLLACGVGLFTAIKYTDDIYNGIYDKMIQDTQAAEWSIKMLAGITTGIVDVVLPIAAANMGGWTARGLERLSSSCCSLFRRPAALDSHGFVMEGYTQLGDGMQIDPESQVPTIVTSQSINL